MRVVARYRVEMAILHQGHERPAPNFNPPNSDVEKQIKKRAGWEQHDLRVVSDLDDEPKEIEIHLPQTLFLDHTLIQAYNRLKTVEQILETYFRELIREILGSASASQLSSGDVVIVRPSLETAEGFHEIIVEKYLLKSDFHRKLALSTIINCLWATPIVMAALFLALKLDAFGADAKNAIIKMLLN